MQQDIINFFSQVMDENRATMVCIEKFSGEVGFDKESSELVFSLHGLYEILGFGSQHDYSVFRKNLYSSTINQALNAFGGSVEIHRSTGKVDDNIYKLTRLK